MFNLTQQERMVLLFIAGVILVGSLLHIVSKQSPELRFFLEFTEKSRTTAQIDINAADAKTLEKLPYVGKATARAIIELRESREKFDSVDDLLSVPGIGPRRLELIKPLVKIGHKGH